jgi:PhnB protein
MPKIDPYLIFDGNCGEAMRFYHATLGGKLDLLTVGQSPAAEHMPPEGQDRIMHARLLFDDGGMLMASDDRPGQDYAGMKNMSVSLIYDGAAEAKGIFEALSAGGRVTMPFDKTFWSEGFGMCVDRFGTPWMVNGGMFST